MVHARIHGRSSWPDVSLARGETFTWYSDGSVVRAGWTVCDAHGFATLGACATGSATFAATSCAADASPSFATFAATASVAAAEPSIDAAARVPE